MKKTSLQTLFGSLISLACAMPVMAATPERLLPAHPVSGQLGEQQAQRYRLTLRAGDFVKGHIAGNGMRLVLMDDRQQVLRHLANGRAERQDFMFVADTPTPGFLEVQASVAGSFTLTLDKVVEKQAQRAPDTLDSPALKALRATLASGGDTASFWEERRRLGTPMVEREGVVPALRPHEVLVTFLWRDARDNVRLFGAPSSDHDPLFRLGHSDVWFRSYRVPDSTLLGYRLAPDVPQLDASPLEQRRAILATAQRDPLNTASFPATPLDRYDGDSVIRLPNAPDERWLDTPPGTPAGTLSHERFASQVLGNTRDVVIYRPHGYRPGAAGNALMVIFDGADYLEKVAAPQVLDALIAAGKIPPTAAILISNPSPAARASELPPNPAFARFLAEELMPWAKQQGVHAIPANTVVAGASYGGLAAAYAGLTHPEWFGKVYSQSGSFWWGEGKDDEEGEWLTRQYVKTARLPVVFHLEAGVFETSHGQSGILETTRHLRDVLQAKGYQVSYRDYATTHGYLGWRSTFPAGVLTLLGKQEGQHVPQRVAPLPR